MLIYFLENWNQESTLIASTIHIYIYNHELFASQYVYTSDERAPKILR